jgi:imidazolonepropionase-like amidohydrolase
MMAAGYRIGLPIAFGSDAIHDLPGHTRGSQTLLWIDSYVAAGLPPSAILRGLTGNAARLLGVDHERGSIRTGLAADLVAVLDNPLADIQTLKRVMFVMKNGRVIRNDTARATS